MFYKIKLRYFITSYNVVAVTGENKNSARGSPRAKTLQMALYDMFVSFIITFFFFKTGRASRMSLKKYNTINLIKT